MLDFLENLIDSLHKTPIESGIQKFLDRKKEAGLTAEKTGVPPQMQEIFAKAGWKAEICDKNEPRARKFRYGIINGEIASDIRVKGSRIWVEKRGDDPDIVGFLCYSKQEHYTWRNDPDNKPEFMKKSFYDEQIDYWKYCSDIEDHMKEKIAQSSWVPIEEIYVRLHRISQ